MAGSIALAFTATPAAHAAADTGSRAPLRALPQPAAAPPTAASATAATATTAAPATAASAGVPAASTPATHTVRAGDTISGIAAAYGLRTADVLAWNDLGWKTVIHPGDVIALSPSAATAGSTSTTSTAKSSTSSAAATHTVTAGDTLWAIAAKHKTSVAALTAANGLSGSLIYPGQKLSIPGAGSTTGSAASSPAPATSNSSTSGSSSASSADSSSHTVHAGDTLWSIAARNDIPLSRLMAANALSGSSIIYPGQTLVIPGDDWVDPAAASATEQKFATLDAEQRANAKTIIAVGRDRGVADRGIAIALAVAMVESGIRNVAYGTYDSLGVFQQRPSTGWGTEEQVMDLERAAAAFYGGPRDPNGATTRGLLDIAGWQNLGFSEAAQAVQVSAYPDRYGQWQTQAFAWLAELG